MFERQNIVLQKISKNLIYKELIKYVTAFPNFEKNYYTGFIHKP